MKSLICSSREVLALLAGRMTQARRLIKPEPRLLRTDLPPDVPHGADKVEHWTIPTRCDGTWASPHRVGDTLYVRETWRPLSRDPDGWDAQIQYKADSSIAAMRHDDEWEPPKASRGGGWVSPLIMPAWASRLHLTITDVRVQRVQDIGEEDARAEGCDGKCPVGSVPAYQAGPYSYHYAQVWESIHGPASWAANPWVWAYTFTVKKIGGS